MDIELIAKVLESKAGYEIGLFGSLRSYRLEDGRFVVEDDYHHFYDIFDKAEDAAKMFIDTRDKYQIGFDYEQEV